MYPSEETFKEAFETRDIRRFLELVFPPEWSAISARILESGVTMSKELCPWAPRWTPVPPTVRKRRGSWPDYLPDLETWVKSCIYRAHDCIHQLWGLPIPGPRFTTEDFYVYKRAQMCGEVAVLTLTEFVLCQRLQEIHPMIRDTLVKRNAIPMLEGPLRGRTVEQIAARLDTLLHKQLRPKWVRDDKASTAFCDDYIPMLEGDRRAIDHNWQLMKDNHWLPKRVPNARYNPHTDGLELTVWMIQDFFHLMDTDSVVDEPLANFNRERRAGLVLPDGWNAPELV
jgi:hypothetical protein